MLYLTDKEIESVGINWSDVTNVLHETVNLVHKGLFAQPLKPYLRYGDKANRIIAMPAFVDGDINAAGIKWIASFPKNLERGIKRAHSITILNNTESGEPQCIVNSSLISGIRTAGVSGLMINKFLELQSDPTRSFNVGLCGMGPIGVLHLKMLMDLLPGRINKICVFDIKTVPQIKFASPLPFEIIKCASWQETFRSADIFITCTTSKEGYINERPRKGSLQLNISLRDYKPECRPYMDFIVVDDWEEVCRENTDIEIMHKTQNLVKSETLSLSQVLFENKIAIHSKEQTIMFNPMGMAVFDIAMASLYYKKAISRKIGISLPS